MINPLLTMTYGPQRTTEMAKVAESVEASFIKEMLTATDLGRTQQGGNDQFRSFLLEAYAERIVQKGGIGLSENILRSMTGKIR